MQRAQVGKITDLDRKVRDFVARDIKLHELVHLSNFFWERDKTVVVGHEALELLEQAHRGQSCRICTVHSFIQKKIKITVTTCFTISFKVSHN